MTTLRLSPYLETASVIHRRDPRAKVLGTVAVVLTISFMPAGAWGRLLCLTGLMWLLAFLGKVPIDLLWRRSLVVLPFILGALVLPFTTAGAVEWTIPALGWEVTSEGAVQAGTLIWRAWLAVQGFIILTATTTVDEIFWSLQALKAPAVFVSVVAFAYRYLYVLVSESARMLRARASRMAGPGPAQPSLAGRLREIGGLVGTLFLRALGRSERVYEAMLGRGYDGTVRQLRRFHMNADDWSGLAALVGVLGVILSWPILPG